MKGSVRRWLAAIALCVPSLAQADIIIGSWNIQNLSWPKSHSNPMVRVPRPSGKPETRSIPRLANEYDTFERCLAYRDQRGREIWGERRWKELLRVEARSVARHRERPAGPITGVYHYERTTGTTLWVTAWYALMPGGSRKKRSAQFSYGTSRTRYATSEEAMQAAIKRRQEEEARWYCVVGKRNQRRVNQ